MKHEEIPISDYYRQAYAEMYFRILKDWKEPEGERHGKYERKVHRRTADKLQELRSTVK